MKNEYFENNICKYCKAQCNKTIVIEESNNLTTIKCSNYQKDDSKIKGYKKPLTRTAKLEHCVMPMLITNWEKRE